MPRFRSPGDVMALGLIILCGALSLVYGGYTVTKLMAADSGSARMQEISAAVREGAQAYLKRQYATIAVVGVVVFIILGGTLCWMHAAQVVDHDAQVAGILAIALGVGLEAAAAISYFAARALGLVGTEPKA